MFDDETWLLEEGDRVIRLEAAGRPSPDARDRLIYCLWVADYGMRNAGDLAAALDLHAGVLDEGRRAAERLGLPRATAMFSLPRERFEERYLDLFAGVVAEIRAAAAGAG